MTNRESEEGGQRESGRVATPLPASSGAKATHLPWPQNPHRQRARRRGVRAMQASQIKSVRGIGRAAWTKTATRAASERCATAPPRKRKGSRNSPQSLLSSQEQPLAHSVQMIVLFTKQKRQCLLKHRSFSRKRCNHSRVIRLLT